MPRSPTLPRPRATSGRGGHVFGDGQAQDVVAPTVAPSTAPPSAAPATVGAVAGAAHPRSCSPGSPDRGGLALTPTPLRFSLKDPGPVPPLRPLLRRQGGARDARSSRSVDEGPPTRQESCTAELGVKTPAEVGETEWQEDKGKEGS